MAEQPTGWDRVTGFFTGVGTVTNQIAGIVDSGANMAEDVARGRGAIADQRLDVEERELSMALDLAQWQRGDNLSLYWVVGAAAVALVAITVMK